MKVGILGTGIGSYHAKLFKKMEGVDVVIFGRNEDKLKKHAENGIKTTTRIDDILNDDSIDIVDVALPTEMHKEYIIEALKRNKHVFCETPLAMTTEEAREVLEAQKRYNKRVLVNQFIKFEPSDVMLYEMVKGNKYGKLQALNIYRKTPPFWGQLGKAKIVTSLMIHEIDLITWILGKPLNVQAVGKENSDGQSQVSALLNYEDAYVNVTASSLIPMSHAFSVGYEAVFEQATVDFYEDGYEDRTVKEMVLFTENESKVLEIKEEDYFLNVLNEVISSIKDNRESRLDVQNAAVSLAVALEIKAQICK